jgi:hypothetical protein
MEECLCLPGRKNGILISVQAACLSLAQASKEGFQPLEGFFQWLEILYIEFPMIGKRKDGL